VAKEAKINTAPLKKLQPEEGKPEGSDHKMDEGSKIRKETTNVKGTMLINGKAPGSNAIIFLETKTKMKAPNQKTLKITIDQSGLQFSPKHTVVPVGSTVDFSNQDVEVHNIYSKSISNQFNLGAMSSGMVKTISLLQPGPIVLRCNLHKDMVGTIFVVPNGYYTQPNKQGDFKFKEVKSAGYIMQAWAPHLAPEDVETNVKTADLNGEDKTFDFDIKTASLPGEIHDMVDPVDYNAIVDSIDNELKQAIQDWEAGKKYISRKRALMAITQYYDGGGLKGALAKSFSEKRSEGLEDKLDDIRKIISGIGVGSKLATGDSLRQKVAFAVAQLRNNVQELEARLNPGPIELKQN
jgi:plastocyanin